MEALIAHNDPDQHAFASHTYSLGLKHQSLGIAWSPNYDKFRHERPDVVPKGLQKVPRLLSKTSPQGLQKVIEGTPNRGLSSNGYTKASGVSHVPPHTTQNSIHTSFRIMTHTY